MAQSKNELLSAQWSARLVMAFIGVPSVGFAVVSGLFNASYAARLGHDGREAAIWILASILITVFVTGLPLAIEILRPRVPHLAMAARGLWIGSLTFSFIAALGFAAVTRGQATAEADATLKDRAGLERAIDRGENELAAMRQHRPAAAVRADLRRAEVGAGVNCDRPRGAYARETCAPVLALRAELAAAEDANRIEAKLETQRAQLDGLAVVGTSSNPQADVLSWIGGGVMAAATWERVLTVFVAGLIELSAALGLAITARSVVELLKAPEEAPAEPVETVTAEPSAMAKVDPEMAFSMWFSSCVSTVKGARITPKDAFAHFEAWAGLNGVNGTLAYHTFGRRMGESVEAIGGKLGNSGGRYYGGVSLAKLGAGGLPLLDRQEEDAAE
jgi:hypothetical protein